MSKQAPSTGGEVKRSNSVGKAEEEFEALIEQFKQKLEAMKPTPSRCRLRPNYSTEWIEELKGKLSKLSNHNDSANSSKDEDAFHQSTSAGGNDSEIIAAVPCAGF